MAKEFGPSGIHVAHVLIDGIYFFYFYLLFFIFIYFYFYFKKKKKRCTENAKN